MYSVSVLQMKMMILTRTRHLLVIVYAPREKCIFRIIMKEFLFSILFISLSSNLKLSIYIFIMSVRHVFVDFQFMFVKRSCSRPRTQEDSSKYAVQGAQNLYESPRIGAPGTNTYVSSLTSNQCNILEQSKCWEKHSDEGLHWPMIILEKQWRLWKSSLLYIKLIWILVHP